jgi:hypothetical protein
VEEDAPPEDPTSLLLEFMQSASVETAPCNVGYDDQARREAWLAAVGQVEVALGIRLAVEDSGLDEDGFGSLRIGRADGPVVRQGPGRIPQHVIDAYERAHRDQE